MREFHRKFGVVKVEPKLIADELCRVFRNIARLVAVLQIPQHLVIILGSRIDAVDRKLGERSSRRDRELAHRPQRRYRITFEPVDYRSEHDDAVVLNLLNCFNHPLAHRVPHLVRVFQTFFGE